jgi:transcriptional regulator with XRE-family HTH domain
MATIEQIRAARALLGWNQHELAAKADLSQTGIARIENGTNKPNTKTMDKILAAFEGADIEFLDDNGVRKRTGQVRILRGADGLRQFFNEMYDCVKNEGGEICLFNGTPARLSTWVGEEWYKMHSERMAKIKDKINYKIIVKKGEKALPAREYATYRFFPENLFTEKTIYIFGNVIFFRDIQGEEIKLIRLEQSDLAQSMKVLFNIAWEKVAEKS